MVAKVPVGAVAGRKTGGHRKLRELAAHVGWSDVHLRGVRDTAHSWPPETRMPVAPFYLHDGFRDGGPERAAWRREQLLTMERGARGRVTQAALRRWRDAQRGDSPSSTSARRRHEVPPEFAEVLERIDALLADVDQLARADGRRDLWAPTRAHLDGLLGQLELIGSRLSA